MRRLGLALAALMMLAPAARAEDTDSDTSGEKPVRCAAPPSLKGEALQAWVPACEFFGALADRRFDIVSERVKAPFFFEGKQVSAVDDVRKKWKELMADQGTTPVPLYGMELFTYDDMVKKYGKPPAKLENVPLRGAFIAVANVDGRAEVAALKRDGSSFAVFAFHD